MVPQEWMWDEMRGPSEQIEGEQRPSPSRLDDVRHTSGSVLTSWSSTPKCPHQVWKALQTRQLFLPWM